MPKKKENYGRKTNLLNLHTDAVLKNIVEIDDYWWEGEFRRKRGIFRRDFVEVIGTGSTISDTNPVSGKMTGKKCTGINNCNKFI